MMGKLVRSIDHFFNNQLPVWFDAIHSTLSVASKDGYYLGTWPHLATWFPLIALIAGLLVGNFHPGYQFVLTESTLLLIIFTFISVINPQWGLLFLLGYIVGDFFGFRIDYLSRFSYRGLFLQTKAAIPLIIYYYLLGLWLIWLPLAARSLTQQSLLFLKGKNFYLTVSVVING